MAKKRTAKVVKPRPPKMLRLGLTLNGRLLHEVVVHHRATVKIEGIVDPTCGEAVDWYDEMALQTTVTPHFDVDDDR